MRASAAIFFGFFTMYVYTAGPSIVPYRDAGEMATSVPTLGILHPTSYPLYSILGAVACQVPLGNNAYRLNVFSALAMALAWAIIFFALRKRFGAATAGVSVLLGGLSYYFWWHALVSEMYALNVLFLAIGILCFIERAWLALAYVLALGLSNRSDLLLTLPAFAIAALAMPIIKQDWTRNHWSWTIAFVVIGLSVYAFLPLRASQQPWINWNDPSNLERLMRTLFRRGYGSGLDLLATNYQPGENFLSEFQIYLQHLWRDFTVVGCLLAMGGVVGGLKSRDPLILLALIGWALTGPIFIYLGNLPPNTHAVAIMQAAYLMPDLFFIIAIAFGFYHLTQNWTGGFPLFKAVLTAIALVVAGFIGVKSYATVDMRNNFLAIDFARNVSVSAPPDALVIGRSDVPIFALYYGFWGESPRPHWIPIAQGLAGSAWYQTMVQRDFPGVWTNSLKTNSDWAQLQIANASRSLMATTDIDWPSDGMEKFVPRGMLLQWTSARDPYWKEASHRLLGELSVYRGRYIYDDYRDFFSNELVEEYAKAWMSIGDEEACRQAWAMKPDMPYAPLQIGYWRMRAGDYAAAEKYFSAALANFETMERLAAAWKTFDNIRRNIERDHQQAKQYWAAAHSRKGTVPR
jgi:hypothetical protein